MDLHQHVFHQVTRRNCYYYLCLDHYLEVLQTKPGALPGATALAQAKTRGVFTGSHQSYWDAARAARGDAKGTREAPQV